LAGTFHAQQGTIGGVDELVGRDAIDSMSCNADACATPAAFTRHESDYSRPR
jgi:hypothetical protein